MGSRLRLARERQGWSRGQLVARLDVDIHVQTIATYELGTRQCPLGRFVAICEALGVPAPELLDDALRNAGVPQHLLACTVDLRAVVRDRDLALEPLRRWARARLKSDPAQARTTHLEPEVVAELAMFCGLSHETLFRRLSDFAPR
ncbi:helix-turn-helix transcriptional regulator [Actinokineospora sp. NBRC 105648]|uniref:helix-turn-helix domain-containing protein n=1 Tax=Actinokineospora sp. NBRC 105648 TaxID=3032206 RepID=UPI0025540E25|nr:helix-turn-helix transcriptional regulator [Actinokineospora sp. NBRC 105648]